jgi:hypothetical protein
MMNCFVMETASAIENMQLAHFKFSDAYSSISIKFVYREHINNKYFKLNFLKLSTYEMAKTLMGLLFI